MWPKRQIYQKKEKKVDNPDVVTVCQFSNNSLFSVKVTTRDDCIFCLVSKQSRLCYFKACKNFWSLSVASGQTTGQLFLPHLDKLSSMVSPLEKYNLTAQLESEYLGGSDIKSQLAATVEQNSHSAG